MCLDVDIAHTQALTWLWSWWGWFIGVVGSNGSGGWVWGDECGPVSYDWVGVAFSSWLSSSSFLKPLFQLLREGVKNTQRGESLKFLAEGLKTLTPLKIYRKPLLKNDDLGLF